MPEIAHAAQRGGPSRRKRSNRRPPPGGASNEEVADLLERVADLLEAQQASPFRVRAYRQGAATLRREPSSVRTLLRREGIPGLERLPGIGRSLAALIREYLETGRARMLERLEGQVSPEDLFATVPGIGEELATRIHRELGIETLEELELAAHDGRLEQVEGFGERRARGVRETLAGMLGRSARRRARGLRAPRPELESPPVATLLAVDAEYRQRAAAGELRTITPRRFNPERAAWLPILHVEREGWSLTALFSNTARAHELGRTRDWVVLYFERDGDEGQCTVVTEHSGSLSGRRVVRGREAECVRFYRGGRASARPLRGPAPGSTRGGPARR